MGRSESLQTRLNDIERRLRDMRTVTNTASAEISGGETIIDVDGSLYFMDGGRLILGGSSIGTTTGKTIVDSKGNLSADTIIVYGDVLSARDYKYQRETFEEEVVNTAEIRSIEEEATLAFPDWSGSALATITVRINTRVASRESNPLLVTLNGKPIARPRTDYLGNVTMNTSTVRRIVPDRPTLKVSIIFDEETVPTALPEMSIKIGGVYSV